MKRVHQSLSMVMLIITVVVVVGCAGVPTQEMSNARQAIKAARDVKAKDYVPTLWNKTEQNLTQAEQHLQAGQFFHARLVAILVKEQAVNAHNMAVAMSRANRVWQAVNAMNYSATQGHALLKKAREAEREGDIDKTIAFANDAYHQGKIALNQAQLEQAKILIDFIKTRQAELHPKELITLKLAETAYHHQEGKKAYVLINRLLNK